MGVTDRTCDAFTWLNRLHGVEGRTGWDGYVVGHGDVGYMGVIGRACDAFTWLDRLLYPYPLPPEF